MSKNRSQDICNTSSLAKGDNHDVSLFNRETPWNSPWLANEDACNKNYCISYFDQYRPA